MIDAATPLLRVRYFAGQVLSAADLQAEQDYFRERLRRHNLAVLGWGVASGLNVGVEGDSVVVGPGYAIGPDGEEIVVSSPLSVALPIACDPVFLALRRQERLVDPVPSPSPTGPGDVEYTRIEESAALVFAADASSSDSIALARLRRGRSGWAPDRRFRPRPLGR